MRQKEQQEYMFSRERERKIEGENEREREGEFQGLPASPFVDWIGKQAKDILLVML